jgi:hypothetical protein
VPHIQEEWFAIRFVIRDEPLVAWLFLVARARRVGVGALGAQRAEENAQGKYENEAGGMVEAKSKTLQPKHWTAGEGSGDDESILRNHHNATLL